jgi:hypothetical protein
MSCRLRTKRRLRRTETWFAGQRYSCATKNVFDQVVKNGAAPEQDELRVVEIALSPSSSRSDNQPGRIATLLFILVAGLLTVFGYFASSICITVLLAGFLAILFDPVVVKLEKLH